MSRRAAVLTVELEQLEAKFAEAGGATAEALDLVHSRVFLLCGYL